MLKGKTLEYRIGNGDWEDVPAEIKTEIDGQETVVRLKKFILDITYEQMPENHKAPAGTKIIACPVGTRIEIRYKDIGGKPSDSLFLIKNALK